MKRVQALFCIVEKLEVPNDRMIVEGWRVKKKLARGFLLAMGLFIIEDRRLWVLGSLMLFVVQGSYLRCPSAITEEIGDYCVVPVWYSVP